MQQKSSSIYIVGDNETVTVEVDAIKVGNFITFSLDGVLLNPISETPRTYRFDVTVGDGFTHFGIISVHFPTAAPDDATYEIFLSGDQGGGKFAGRHIVKTNVSWSRGLEFRRP